MSTEQAQTHRKPTTKILSLEATSEAFGLGPAFRHRCCVQNAAATALKRQHSAGLETDGRAADFRIDVGHAPHLFRGPPFRPQSCEL